MVKAMIANDIYKRDKTKPSWWIEKGADLNMSRMICMFQGRCKGYLKRGKNRKCCKPRKCMRSCGPR